MTSEQNGEAAGRLLNDVVRDADEYYTRLKGQHANQTRVHIVVIRWGHRFGRKGSAGCGGVSLLFFIAFCIKAFIDGKWNVPIATFTLDYAVGSVITILVWGLISSSESPSPLGWRGGSSMR